MIQIGIVYLLYHQTVQVTLATLPEGLSPLERMNVQKMLEDQQTIEILFKPIRMTIGCVFFAIILCGLLRQLFPLKKPKFISVFSLVVHAEIILLLSQIGIFIRNMSLRNNHGFSVPMSLDCIFPQASYLASFVLNSFSLFHVWSMVVITIGIVEITRIHWLKAISTLLVSWIVVVGLSTYVLYLIVVNFRLGV
jgi:hypothetical protein